MRTVSYFSEFSVMEIYRSLYIGSLWNSDARINESLISIRDREARRKEEKREIDRGVDIVHRDGDRGRVRKTCRTEEDGF